MANTPVEIFYPGPGITKVGASGEYFQGYTGPVATVSWTTTSASFVDPTITGTPTLTTREANGLTVIQEPTGLLPGIAFTPASNTAVYLITATLQGASSSNSVGSFQLTDGTTVISAGAASLYANTVTNALYAPVTMTGVYMPNTTARVTVKIQMANGNAGNTYIISSSDLGGLIEWTIVRIA
jgi:hypothetical protein